jgi:ribonuclease HI
MWGKKADTSNNEMEYQAILSALEVIPKGAYACFETDSQQCIDGLTKYRERWEAHRWRREDGQPVVNAELIKKICPLLDQGEVGFRKIKAYSHDPWNDLADKLAVKGRNPQAQDVVIHLIFKAVIEGKEKTFCFDRFSVNALANIYDFWPRLLEKAGDRIGNPEDYEIWHDRCKLGRGLVTGGQYEILAKRTPGLILPAEIRAQRRTSADFGLKPLISQNPPR